MLKKILVVDDDLKVWNLSYKNAFRERGYSLKLFSNPLEANRYMEESGGDYDAAIFDVKYEKNNRDNYSVFNLISLSRAFSPNAPIVIFTGYDAPESSGKGGWSPGVLKWIVKPEDCIEIIKTFDDYFALKE